MSVHSKRGGETKHSKAVEGWLVVSESYQPCNNEAIVPAEPPYWPHSDVDAGKEGNEAEPKESNGGADVNP